MQEKVSALFGMTGDTERAKQYVASWINHYRLADAGKFLEDMNSSLK